MRTDEETQAFINAMNETEFTIKISGELLGPIIALLSFEGHFMNPAIFPGFTAILDQVINSPAFQAARPAAAETSWPDTVDRT